MSCITLQCWLSIYLQMHIMTVNVNFHDGKGKTAGILWTCQTAVLTWEASCLVACKSSVCLGGKVRRICNKICGSFSPPWKKTNRVVRSMTKGTPIQSKSEQHIHSLFDDPRLLQQVLGYLGPNDCSSGCELHLQVFAEAAGVVIDGCAGVSEGLYKRVHLQDLLTQCPIVCLWATTCFFNKVRYYFEIVLCNIQD